jgi:flagellar biosynthesis protein FlhA
VDSAAQSYTLLTVGDGLVSQIPALIISTASGMLVSRATSDAGMGHEFIRQFGVQPEALVVTSGVMFLFGMVPGLPIIPFSVLSAGVGSLAWLAYRERTRVREQIAAKEALPVASEAPEPGTPEDVERLLALDMLELEVGYGLIPLVDEEQGGDLLERIKSIRRQFAQDMGIIVPPLHVRDNLQLNPGEYTILIKGIDVAKGELMIGYLLAMDPGDAKRELQGIATTEPAFGLPAVWIPESSREEAQLTGYTVVDLSTVVATHLAELIRQNADDLLGRQEVQRLLDTLSKSHPKAVEDATNSVSLGVIQKVLQYLVKERISIRDLLTIVETLADYGHMTKDPEILAEYVRQKLGRAIVRPFLGPDNSLYVMTIEAGLEEKILKGVQHTEHGSFLALDPATAQRIIKATQTRVEEATRQGHQAIILCNPNIRRHLKKLLERFIPNITVLSHSEITGNVRLESVAVIR